jgi:hypothetical protein
MATDRKFTHIKKDTHTRIKKIAEDIHMPIEALTDLILCSWLDKTEPNINEMKLAVAKALCLDNPDPVKPELTPTPGTGKGGNP